MKNTFKTFNMENFFYIVFGFYLASIFFMNTTLEIDYPLFAKTTKLLRYSCYLIFAFKIVVDWARGSKISITMLLCFVIAVLVMCFSKKNELLTLLLTLLACKNTELSKLFKVSLGVYGSLFFLIINLSLLKVLPDWTFNRPNIVRHSLGFYYPTITMGIFLIIVLLYFYLRRNNCTFIELLVLETLNVFLFSYTDGRLSFTLVTFILLLMALSKSDTLRNWLQRNRVLRKIFLFSPILLFVGSFILIYLYYIQNDVGLWANRVLSERLKYSLEALKSYKIGLLGQDIQWNGWGGYGYAPGIDLDNFKYNYVDISYLRVLFDYGIIVTVGIIVAYTALLKLSYKQKDYWLVATLLLILAWSFVEPYIITFGRNLFVLAFIPLLDIGEIKFLQFETIKNRLIKKHN